MKKLMFICVLLVSFSAHAQSGQSSEAGVPVVHSIEQSPETVENYWTPERMRDAQPMPMPSVSSCGEEVKQCPNGYNVFRIGPNCEFAPCSGDGAGVVEGVGAGFSEGKAGYAPSEMYK